MPASSTCSMTPAIRGLVVRHDVDVDLDRILQVAVDQDWPNVGDPRCVGHEAAHFVHRVDDAHRPTAQHVGGPNHQGEAQRLRLLDRVRDTDADVVVGLLQSQPMQQLLEALAILGEVDRVGRGAQDRDARLLQRVTQL